MNTNPKAKIDVSSSVVAVSLEKSSSYFFDEVKNEGNLRSDTKPMIILPSSESGSASDNWIREILKLQNDVRDDENLELIELGGNNWLDIGMIDIQVFFDGDSSHIQSILTQQPNLLLEENFKHIEGTFGSIFHDQMIVSSALHTMRPNGEFLLHYHNVIFSLRKEGSLVGLLPMPQLLRKLASIGNNIGFVA